MTGTTIREAPTERFTREDVDRILAKMDTQAKINGEVSDFIDFVKKPKYDGNELAPFPENQYQ